MALDRLHGLHGFDRDTLLESDEAMGTQIELAELWFGQGLFNRARALYEVINDIHREQLGEEHESTLQSGYYLAFSLAETEELRKAEKILEPISRYMTRLWGPTNEWSKAAVKKLESIRADLGG